MRLAISIPDNYREQTVGGRPVAIRLDDGGKPAAALSWSAIEILPDEQKRWVQQTLREDIPATAKVSVKSDETVATDSGWPLRLVVADVVDANDDPIERRLVGFYAFLEHAATALFRSKSIDLFNEDLEAAQDAFKKARPDWSDEVCALAQLWDVVVAPLAKEKSVATASGLPQTATRLEKFRYQAVGCESKDEIRELVPKLRESIEDGGDDVADLELLLGRVHAAIGEYDAAMESLRSALAKGADPVSVQLAIGQTMISNGNDAEAIKAWQAAADVDPTGVDGLYNIGLAHYANKNFEAACTAWSEALERTPRDFWILRKLIQAQFALRDYEGAIKTRAQLLDVHRGSTEPAVQLANEFVFDQFEVAEYLVHGSETLRPRDRGSYSIYTFRLADLSDSDSDSDHDLPNVSVQIETSDYAKQRGVPFVLSVIGPRGYRVVGTTKALPAYAELRATVEELITAELGAGKPSPNGSN